MNKSESVAELAKALCKAQAVIEGAAKDKNNPAFRSKYADLASCWDAARKPLTDNGLSVMQFPRLTESGVEVETIVLHSSGEFMSETLGIPLGKRDAHGVGAAITYGRRFGFSALVGICPEDDDGNGAVGKGKHDEKPEAPRGSAKETMQEVFDALPPAEQEKMRSRAQAISEIYAAKGIGDAVDHLHGLKLTADGKMAIWYVLDSAMRSSIKREEERRRALVAPEAAEAA